MKRNLFLWCLLFFCFALLSCGPGFASQKEMAEFMEEFAAYKQKRKEAVTKLASAPLNEDAQKLLTQLLDEKGSLDAILSNQLYLDYLKIQVGKAYEDFPTYLAKMPTSELKSTTTLALKKILPLKATPQEIQHCVNFYFKVRKLFAQEPDIVNKNIEKFTEFQLKHFNEPLMKQYSKEELLPKLAQIMQLGMVPSVIAGLETQVYHDAWHQRLKTHGAREGLLRCAIATPGEFVLTRSFFENAEALEKWILTPLGQQCSLGCFSLSTLLSVLLFLNYSLVTVTSDCTDGTRKDFRTHTTFHTCWFRFHRRRTLFDSNCIYPHASTLGNAQKHGETALSEIISVPVAEHLCKSSPVMVLSRVRLFSFC